MKVAYIDASAGASGDMLLGALLDSCIEISDLEGILLALDVSGVALEANKDVRRGVSGTYIAVVLSEEARQPRRWQDFVDIVQHSSLSEKVKEKSTAVFKLIGDAEAKVHGTDPEHVNLHELGTLDTLIDVVGVVAALEKAGIQKVYSSSLPIGSGRVSSAHGIMTVPTPATLAILALTNAKIYPPENSSPSTGEILTPTGAAILSTLAEFTQPVMTLEAYGFGLGSRDPIEYPNVLSLSVGKLMDPYSVSTLVILETNLDDTTGEVLGYVQERLFSIGARDVWFSPIQMKKNRPATILSVLIDENLRAKAIETIFKETSTLGIRVRPTHRVEAEREVRKLDSTYGVVDVKVKIFNGEIILLAPEYDDCRLIALDNDLPITQVMGQIRKEAENAFLC